MSRRIAILIGGMLLAIGLLWTLQGLGYVGGSAMSGDDKWAIIGPLVSGFGVALVIVSVRRR